MKQTIIHWIKKDVILMISWILAILFMVVVPPDKQYLEYIDWKTLGLLFSLMAVMAGLKEMGVFQTLGKRLLSKVKSKRGIESVLVLLCFFSSMIVTNDVALITFVPFAIEVLTMANKKKSIVFVVVMQTIAANLGSMFTPIGNPQNLYIYAKSQMPLQVFFITIAPYVVLSFVLIMICLLCRKNELVKANLNIHHVGKVKKEKLVAYGILFVLNLLCVGKITPVWMIVIITVIMLSVMDRKIFGKIDYALLFTFIGFFLFVGNMGRITTLKQWIEAILQKNELLTIIGTSQVISNVPTALLLSGFTSHWEILLIGTNLGGLGTMIASMASLISYKYIAKELPNEKGQYVISFTICNIGFLVLLVGLYLVIS